ncbi:MAG TPA: DUF1850 domain-containing protein [Clostridia bacterium]|nr:DUF1850 domain-containing protein [Clostridia bacterium]
MKKTALILFAIAIASIIILYQYTEVLVVAEVESNRIVHTERINPGDVFTVKWIHSVELEPWEEQFEVGKDMEIYLEETRFKAFGAGVPDSAGSSTEVKDGYVVFSGIHKKMPNLVYGVSPIAKHTLVIKDKVLSLYELLPPDTAVSFNIKSISLWKYIVFKL